MRPIRVAGPVLALVVALLLLAPARAEDSPTQAYASATDALPAPASAHALDFDGQGFLGEMVVGTFTFRAQPSKGSGDEPVWEVTEGMDFGNGASVRNSTCLLDRHLNPLRGKITGKEPGVDSFDIRWERTATGFRIEHAVTRGGETTTEEKAVEHAGRVVSTITSLWLFARMTLPKQADYEALVFDPDPDEGEGVLETSTWRTGDEGTWEGRKTLTVRGTKGKKTLVGHFDPAGFVLLGVEAIAPGQPTALLVRPRTEEAPAEKDDLYGRPAKTAKEAAMQGGLGYAAADIELLGRALHWPSLHQVAKARHDADNAGNPDAEPFEDVEAFRTRRLAELEASLTKRPKPMIQGALEMMKEALETEAQDDGSTIVTFPPMFQGIKLTVREIDGVWYVVRPPSRPE